MQLFFRSVRVLQQGDADVIEAFERAHRCGAYGYGLPLVGYQLFYRAARYGDVLCVHLVPFDFFALHGAEGAGTYVQRQFFQVNAFCAECVEHAGREVQSGCRGSYGAFYLGVNRLIGLLVAFLCLAVQVGRDGQLAEHFEDVGKGHLRIVPAEVHPVTGAAALAPLGSQRQRASFYGHLAAQGAFLPFLQVAHHAEPGGVLSLLEVQHVVVWLDGFQAKNFDQCARLLAEVQAGLNDLGVVEHHQATCRHVVGQGGEAVFGHLSVAVNQ